MPNTCTTLRLSILFSLRRAYAVAATERVVKLESCSSISMARKVGGDELCAGKSETEEETGGQMQVFWMKHPKTGVWMPENHFDQADVPDLRAKLLRKNHPN